ncbi:TolB-like translocation protein [Deferrisoma palaeochoriense]
MLQWLPGQDDLVIFNDVEDRKLVAKVMNPFTGRNYRVLDAPVQSVSPDGRIALAINYKRLFRLRPEYGYAPDVENFAPDMELGEDGIWKMDLGSGRVELIISLHQLIAYRTRDDMAEAEHKVNHLVVSPSGDRFAFMHRWIGPKGKFSRLYTANCDGTELCLLADDRMVSHYAWKNRHQLLAWARKEPYGDHYFLFEDRSDRFEIIGEGMLDRFGDGHPSFSPDGRWIVTDTYPDRARMRSLLLFDTLGNRVILVGRFFAPWDFDGPTRCDLHPRWHPEGRSISVDSAHEGVRKSYIIDVEKVVKNGKT